MSNQRIMDLLDKQRVPYLLLSHSPAYSAQRIAQAAHIPGRQLAKTVMMDIDGELAMVVIPADTRCRLARLAEATNSDEVRLAQEHDFGRYFPDCDLGAIPPFGSLWNVRVYVSRALLDADYISFPDGDVREIITMDTADYLGLEEPWVLEPSVHT
ncbi:MAG: YbaK/EbsC family protein [Myxococcales bacterium]|nr:YbaK/EbsC family protein [Myxococcales bacterium]